MGNNNKPTDLILYLGILLGICFITIVVGLFIWKSYSADSSMLVSSEDIVFQDKFEKQTPKESVDTARIINLRISTNTIYLDGDSICTVTDIDTVETSQLPLYNNLVTKLKSELYRNRSDEQILVSTVKSVDMYTIHVVMKTLGFCKFKNMKFAVIQE